MKEPAESEIKIRDVVRKSIVAKKDVENGSTITDGMVTIKRPGTGIPPHFLNTLIGKTTNCDIKKDAILTWDMIEE